AGWASNDNITSNHTEWVKMDLAASYSISKVDLYPRNNSGYVGEYFPVDFTIKVSTDDTNWSTVVTQTGYAKPGDAVQSFTFSSQSARYVKIEGTNLRQCSLDSNYYRMVFAEIEVYN
ncbi:MAG: discoidin domain-containing protein, partial [Clostridiales bacterium]|nr:discoidin domain-containing protein [Clostridiales bacterium]